jgi:hypothetical protein
MCNPSLSRKKVWSPNRLASFGSTGLSSEMATVSSNAACSFNYSIVWRTRAVERFMGMLLRHGWLARKGAVFANAEGPPRFRVFHDETVLPDVRRCRGRSSRQAEAFHADT